MMKDYLRTFLAGDDLMKKFVKISVTVFLIALAWSMFIPHRYECKGPMSREVASRKSPIDLPDSAENVYVATYNHWQAYANYVRFNAPLAECESFAANLVGDKTDFTTITSNAPPRWNYVGFKAGLGWFDIQNIKKGRSWRGDSSVPNCWIDSEREILYYFKTD